MSSVRVLVGTRKGAFVLTADGTRKQWNVAGPHFGGWEVFHVKGSPADPNRIYAAQHADWFGQVVQRSDDGGGTWDAVGNEFAYEGETGTHLWYDGTPHPWEFKRVWHVEPSPSDPDTVYAGVEDAALFRSTDGGKSWQEVSGLRRHPTGSQWQPGAGGLCLHTVLLDSGNAGRMYTAISAAGAFRSDDAGQTWKPVNRGLKSEGFLPEPTRRWATACTASRCTRRGPTSCSCRSTGNSAITCIFAVTYADTVSGHTTTYTTRTQRYPSCDA